MQEYLVLLGGHFLADFPLQPQHMLTDKQQAFKTSLGTLTLIAHAFIHGLILGLLAYWLNFPSPLFMGLGVGLSHFVIDLAKVRGFLGVWTDQVLHWFVICLIWILLS